MSLLYKKLPKKCTVNNNLHYINKNMPPSRSSNQSYSRSSNQSYSSPSRPSSTQSRSSSSTTSPSTPTPSPVSSSGSGLLTGLVIGGLVGHSMGSNSKKEEIEQLNYNVSHLKREVEDLKKSDNQQNPLPVVQTDLTPKEGYMKLMIEQLLKCYDNEKSNSTEIEECQLLHLKEYGFTKSDQI